MAAERDPFKNYPPCWHRFLWKIFLLDLPNEAAGSWIDSSRPNVLQPIVNKEDHKAMRSARKGSFGCAELREVNFSLYLIRS